MPAPSLAAAASLGARAAVRNAWLGAVAFAVALVRRALTAPAAAVGAALVIEGAGRAARPLSPASLAEGAIDVATSARFLGIVGGLWLAGSLLGAALRAAYLAGALPTLGGALAREPDPPPRFASGAAFGFGRVAATAALGWIAELSGALFLAAIALGGVLVSSRAAESRDPVALAAAIAAALTLGIAVRLALSVVADAGVARAALRAEGPAEALAAAGARLLARPGTFLLAGMAFGALGALAAVGIRTLGAVSTGFASGLDLALLVGPQLMVSVAGTLVAAALDLWWLATVAVLAAHEDAVAAG